MTKPVRPQAGPYDAVICDIDGCLSPESTTPFDLASLAELARRNRRAIETGQGPIVTLCSGRPQPFAEAMTRAIGNTHLPLVCENGVWLYDPRDNTSTLDPRITNEHLAIVRDAEAWVRSQLGPRGVTIQPGKAASVSLYHPDPAYLRDKILTLVAQAFRVCGWPFRVSMTWFYINCDLDFISKATGIERLIERTGLDPTRLAGIGDTPSDAAIADHVAWFGCPANADEKIKPRADVVSEKAEAEGVLELLDQLAP
ncbi:MAG: HAD family hydrolase [Phycisphaerales bacterium JB037]